MKDGGIDDKSMRISISIVLDIDNTKFDVIFSLVSQQEDESVDKIGREV